MKKTVALVLSIILAAACITSCEDSSSKRSENTASTSSSSSDLSSEKSITFSSEAPETSEKDSSEQKGDEKGSAFDKSEYVFGVWESDGNNVFTDSKDKEVLLFTKGLTKKDGSISFGSEPIYYSIPENEDKMVIRENSETESAVLSKIDILSISKDEMKLSLDGKTGTYHRSEITEDKANDQYMANMIAKEIYTRLNTEASDMIADGKAVKALVTDKPVPVANYKNSTDPLEMIVAGKDTALTKKGIYTTITFDYDKSYVYLHFDKSNEKEPCFVQWSSSEAGAPIGQYPEPPSLEEMNKIEFGTQLPG